MVHPIPACSQFVLTLAFDASKLLCILSALNYSKLMLENCFGASLAFKGLTNFEVLEVAMRNNNTFFFSLFLSYSFYSL